MQSGSLAAPLRRVLMPPASEVALRYMIEAQGTPQRSAASWALCSRHGTCAVSDGPLPQFPTTRGGHPLHSCVQEGAPSTHGSAASFGSLGRYRWSDSTVAWSLVQPRSRGHRGPCEGVTMPVFEHHAPMPASQSALWAWHDSPEAFVRIMPEWERLTPVQLGSLEDGQQTRFKMRLGPLRPM